MESCEFKPLENSTIKKSHECTRSAKNYKGISSNILYSLFLSCLYEITTENDRLYFFFLIDLKKI